MHQINHHLKVSTILVSLVAATSALANPCNLLSRAYARIGGFPIDPARVAEVLSNPDLAKEAAFARAIAWNVDNRDTVYAKRHELRELATRVTAMDAPTQALVRLAAEVLISGSYPVGVSAVNAINAIRGPSATTADFHLVLTTALRFLDEFVLRYDLERLSSQLGSENAKLDEVLRTLSWYKDSMPPKSLASTVDLMANWVYARYRLFAPDKITPEVQSRIFRIAGTDPSGGYSYTRADFEWLASHFGSDTRSALTSEYQQSLRADAGRTLDRLIPAGFAEPAQLLVDDLVAGRPITRDQRRWLEALCIITFLNSQDSPAGRAAQAVLNSLGTPIPDIGDRG